MTDQPKLAGYYSPGGLASLPDCRAEGEGRNAEAEGSIWISSKFDFTLFTLHPYQFHTTFYQQFRYGEYIDRIKFIATRTTCNLQFNNLVHYTVFIMQVTLPCFT